MARKRISEWKAKTLINQALHLPYFGHQWKKGNNINTLAEKLDKKAFYVVKVDEGVKRRFKNGLVKINIPMTEVIDWITSWEALGYTQFLVEPYIVHTGDEERYIAIERVREGKKILSSLRGGIEIESKNEVQTNVFSDGEAIPSAGIATGFTEDAFNTLLAVFDAYYISFLEINPFIRQGAHVEFLDMAVEVDSTAEFFVKNVWTENDFVSGITEKKTEEEKVVTQLAAKSQAAFSLEVLNENGSVFMLLSGGGASIVLADEMYHLGYGKELANYGEYSGNPNAEETYLYTKQMLQLLLRSHAKKKVLIIGGGVANFTDIRITFRGIIKALHEMKEELKKQPVKVFVRRGGPYQEEGLKEISVFLEKERIKGIVAGPEMMLTDIIHKAVSYIHDD